jgi:hypothetical protein
VKRKAKREMLSRQGRITEWRATVFPHTYSSAETGVRPSTPYLELIGSFSESVKDVTRFRLSVAVGPTLVERGEVPSVGFIHKAKPEIEGILTLSSDEFSALLTLATSGTPIMLDCMFQMPRYGSAFIQNAEFTGVGSAST